MPFVGELLVLFVGEILVLFVGELLVPFVGELLERRGCPILCWCLSWVSLWKLFFKLVPILMENWSLNVPFFLLEMVPKSC